MPGNFIFFRILVLALTVSVAGPWNGRASADDIICPKNIVALEGDFLNQWAKTILMDMYRDLGCDTEFSDVPARRGIHYFNTGVVDGEVYRMRQVEKLYERKFLRSGKPLFMLTNSLWLHPELKNSDRYLIGYVGGVVWQENYIKNVQGKSFASSRDMFQAYNRGQIRGFLAANPSVLKLISIGELSPIPERAKVLLDEPLYHYVGGGFEAFIEAFTEKLKNQPFKNVDNIGGN